MNPRPPPSRFRFTGLDAAVLCLAVLVLIYLGYRVDQVLNYRWQWDFLPGYFLRWDAEQQQFVANILLQGLIATVRLAVLSLLLAAAIGLVIGVMATLPRLLPRLISRSYVELIRNLPPLVFVFVFYFFLSSQWLPLLGISDWVRQASPETLAAWAWLVGPPARLENLIAGVLCLALFEGAYVAEIVRAGVQSIPQGQWEAGRALGLSERAILRHIVLPQALRNVLPPLANQFIILVKDSAIVSLISVQELTFLATEVAVSTNRVFETWLVVAGLYFVLCYGLARVFRRLEHRR